MDDSGLSVVTPPDVEPVTLAQAKAQVRVELTFTADDAYLGTLITAARMRVEADTGRAMINTAYRLTLPGFPDGDIQLPRGPLVALDEDDAPLTTLAYTDSDGDTQALTLDTDFAVAEGRLPARVASLDVWPTTTAAGPNVVRVEWTAGHGTTSADVPAPLRQAVLMMVGHWYERRELVVMGRSAPTPLSLEWLLAPFYDGRY